MPENQNDHSRDMMEYIPDPALQGVKDRKKAIRSVVQALFLISLVLLYISTIIDYPKYKPYDHQNATAAAPVGADNGFISVSYFGVARATNETLISVEKMQEHLQALKDSGYVTITQEDIFDYYENGTPLPERALFLFYEDGRRDTAIFAQPVLEDLNYCATILTYANNLDQHGTKFLKTEDIKLLDRGSFWETGTNGYRLSYINVFDRYDRYLGEMTASEFSVMAKYLGRNYNHYLMDFIRDENDVPLESYSGMSERINADYSLMRETYDKELGFLPPLYVLMHSNTGKFATNDRVSGVNELALRATFHANFNREGFCLNRSETDPYDLTRMQPQSYWSTNHLLMRCWYDTNLPMAFVTGDERRNVQWSLINGACEHKLDRLILTSLPSGDGTVRLDQSGTYADFELNVRLLGNKLGTQRVFLRADEDRQNYVCVEIRDDVLYIYSAAGGGENELFSISLDELYGTEFQTLAENSEEARKAAMDAKKHYGESTVENAIIVNDLEKENVAESEEDYIPTLDLRTAGDTKLKIRMNGSAITVSCNGYTAVENMEVPCPSWGYVFLGSRCGSTEGGYSQRNLADDVYDAVFNELKITTLDNNTVLYDYLPAKSELARMRAKDTWNGMVDWFIDNL